MSVEVHVAEADFRVGEAVYPRGTHVVFSGQTARPFILSLLSRTVYRDSPWVRAPDGSPMMNYDFATQTMAEFKGVRVVEAGRMPEGRFGAAPPMEPPKGSVEKSGHGHVFDGRINDSFKALNALPSVKAIYAIHYNTQYGDAGNPPPEFIANKDNPNKGEYIKASINPTKRTFTIQIGPEGKKWTYAIQ